ncbi:DUF6913 domain-containing protein [Roseivirga misakiensis]|uniref:Uncharacterized protein n=1 Tax=Roseivirga misakiensis TaxID=1563681 RepID=A0A1E5T1J6_9BACT|nr:hypothetical protein [Roseivirga misakiensis]OEK05252.1 hypothetical protein BFP71_17775 [Roseivirga misakiensis]
MSIFSKKLLNLFNKTGKRDKKNLGPIIPFDQADKVGIIYTWKGPEKETEIENFIQSLIDENKSVDVLCYNPTKEPIQTKHPFVSLSDLSALGKLNSEAALQFGNTPLDFLFHLDYELDDILRSILIQTNAKCRVGHHSPDNSAYYELMIGIDKSNSLSNFTAQILKYIKAIK